jgi:hypothetical protein
MPTTPLANSIVPPRLPSLVLGLVALAVGLVAQVGISAGAGDERRAKIGAANEQAFDEPGACMDCHAFPKKQNIDKGALSFVLLTEYSAWKTFDKHAQAYAVLKGPRGEEMAAALRQDVTQVGTGCLNCHAMNYVESEGGKPYDPEEGVSCGGCHGPSENTTWRGEHSVPAWRELSPEAKRAKGMWDVRDPESRARLCASCHVGNASQGKVVTHAMYAAGHPPLPPFEVTMFSRNMPQHWRDMKDVPYFRKAPENVKKDYPLQGMEFQHTWFALIGGVINFRESMQIIADRANAQSRLPPLRVWPELSLPGERGEGHGGEDPSPSAAMRRWPELAMSHSDCYACHHDLQYPSWRQQRGYGFPLPDGRTIKVAPGRPQVRLWPLALLEAAIRYNAIKKGEDREAEVNKQVKDIEEDFTALVNSCNDKPFGNAEAVGKAAQALAGRCKALVAALKAAPPDQRSALELLHILCSLKTARFADYETARQIAAVLTGVYEEVVPHYEKAALDPMKAQRIRSALSALQVELNLVPSANRDQRQKVINRFISELDEKEGLRGMTQLYRALQDLGNIKLQESQRDNPFLNTLGIKLSNKDLTKKLLQPKAIKQLQTLSDEELAITLGKINSFDPKLFQERLKEIASGLPPLPRP